MYCQKCHTLLMVDDDSLDALNPAPLGLIASPGACCLGFSSHDPGSFYGRLHQWRDSFQPAYVPVNKRETPQLVHEHNTGPRPRAGLKDGPNMSFVVLTESQLSGTAGASGITDDGPQHPRPKVGQDGGDKSFSHFERATYFFETVSARTDIDQPVCVDCAELLAAGVQSRLIGATRERDSYVSFLRNVNASIPSQEEVNAARQSLQTILEAEGDAFHELQMLENEKFASDREIAILVEQCQQLDRDEEQFWTDQTTFGLTLGGFLNDRDTLNVKFDHDSRQLERLQRTNVYNDTFCIGHDGYFGTINGLRLGRLGNPPVEWAEVNAAWGQTVLLLSTIANKFGFQFEGYRLRPMGSVSRIEKVEQSQREPNFRTGRDDNLSPIITSLDLFSSGDLPLNLPWLHRRFDAGMVAFLECLRQLGVYLEKVPLSNGVPAASSTASAPREHRNVGSYYRSQSHSQPSTFGMKLPYEIQKDRIGDTSIRLGFNQTDESWTRACKYMLTCCKFLLANASNFGTAKFNNCATESSYEH
uniref:Beclin-1 n=1 Tax=Coccidioides posadasii RMSCC 3488 TaxID=454284 RepID=A0A0J6HZF0_COCPO|nr:beclin-1 [Coccidioides posadasii RMSCC 3488]